jgi:hypothetical protein
MLFLEICNIFAEMIPIDNNENSSAILSNWTLLSGDYVHFTYTLLAKIDPNNNIAIKFYHGSYLLEIIPMETVLKIMFDGSVISESLNEIVLPLNEKSFYNSLIR